MTAIKDRHKQIALALADGQSVDEIAAALFLSRTTVKKDIEAIRDTYGVGTFANIAAYALRNGWIE